MLEQLKSGHLISHDEMISLTGRRRAKDQVMVLRANGLRFTTDARGAPRLTWESYNQQVSGGKQQESFEPNFGAI